MFRMLAHGHDHAEHIMLKVIDACEHLSSQDSRKVGSPELPRKDVEAEQFNAKLRVLDALEVLQLGILRCYADIS